MIAPRESGLATPCLQCGTTGGYVIPGRPRPTRTRGLCCNCEHRHRAHGTLDRFPHTDRRYDPNPIIPRHYLDPYMLGSDRTQHAVIPGYDWREVDKEAMDFALAWIATHPRARNASLDSGANAAD